MDQKQADRKIQSYSDVPWNRRSTWNILFVVLSCTIGIPFFIITFWALFTGEIYYNKPDENGNLRTWGRANKLLALYIVLFWAVVFVIVLIAK
jgi:hypothetical protein